MDDDNNYIIDAMHPSGQLYRLVVDQARTAYFFPLQYEHSYKI